MHVICLGYPPALPPSGDSFPDCTQSHLPLPSIVIVYCQIARNEAPTSRRAEQNNKTLERQT